MKTNKAILIITDGIGYNSSCKDNAFCNAKKPTYDYLFAHVPYSLVKTSGLSVGLPEGQMGNSEVGHMCIGSGRILYQNLVKITKSVEEGTLGENPVLVALLSKSNAVHVMGLMSDGGVHSHIDHIIALAKTASAQGKKVYLHLITDGRDVSPTSAAHFLAQIEKVLDENIVIATLGGRFFAMDRDNRWERVEKGYRAIAEGLPKTDLTPLAYIQKSYEEGILDEFIEPVSFGSYAGFAQNDGVIFANFRSDRMREIVEAVANADFNRFARADRGLHVVTMTQYSKDFPYPVMFEEDLPTNTLAQVISEAGLRQFHTAETEKYAHVTFFLNGGVEEPFENETRVLVPSPNVKTYDLQPHMSAEKVGSHVCTAMREGYDFVVVNFANGDMVGHTGDYQAAIKAVEAVDAELGKIIEVAKAEGYNLVITSDHGNCEQMKDEKGKVLTNHTLFEVFCFVMSDGVASVKAGGLNNIAPTVLKLMNLPIPEVMDAALI